MLIRFLNAILIYGIMVAMMRAVGKRQLGELELSELIVTILISELAALPIQDPEVPLGYVFAPIGALLAMEFLLSLLSLKSVRFRGLVTGKPSLLVVNGRIDQRQMRKNRITPEELVEAMRGDGILDLNDVQYAILETSGRLNIIPIPAERAVTAGQMGLPLQDGGYPMIVVDNGRVLSHNLRLLGRDENWLIKKLRENGLRSPEEVYMMTADRAGGIFLAPKEED